MPPASSTTRTSCSDVFFGQATITSPPGSRKIFPCASSARRDVRITLRGSCPPGTRAVRSGSSLRAVSPPTSTASTSDRIRCTRRRAASPVIHRESPPAAAICPSREMASFSVTNGLPETTHRQNPRLSSRASASIDPRCTTRPAPRSRLAPRPETAGFGSSIAYATRAIPAARIAAVHGPVRPRWSHGSSVTYRSAPRAAIPARCRASISAWGSPAAWWYPSPTTRPPRTTTAPTAGLGAVRPAPFRASRSARRMNPPAGNSGRDLMTSSFGRGDR